MAVKITFMVVMRESLVAYIREDVKIENKSMSFDSAGEN